MKLTVLIASVCLTVLSGCALQQDLIGLNDRVIALEERNRDLERREATSKKESVQLQSRIENYSKINDEKAQKLRSQSAELQAMFDGFREEIQGLSGKLEETDHLIRQKIKTLEDSGKSTENQLKELEQKLEQNLNARAGRSDSGMSYQVDPTPVSDPIYSKGSSRDRARASDSARADTRKSQVANGLSENELYALAKQAFDRGEFQTAREGFQTLITTYPKSRRADNAQFWIGEIYYRERRYEEAILEYQEVIEKYPNGNKVKAALLKQGFAFFNLGDKPNARLILQELADRYPDSHEAKLAKDKLDWF